MKKFLYLEKMFFFGHERGTERKNILIPHEESNLRPSDSKLTIFLILCTNMTLSTSLILAADRTLVMYINFVMDLVHHRVSLAQK